MPAAKKGSSHKAEPMKYSLEAVSNHNPPSPSSNKGRITGRLSQRSIPSAQTMRYIMTSLGKVQSGPSTTLPALYPLKATPGSVLAGITMAKLLAT